MSYVSREIHTRQFYCNVFTTFTTLSLPLSPFYTASAFSKNVSWFHDLHHTTKRERRAYGEHSQSEWFKGPMPTRKAIYTNSNIDMDTGPPKHRKPLYTWNPLDKILKFTIKLNLKWIGRFMQKNQNPPQKYLNLSWNSGDIHLYIQHGLRSRKMDFNFNFKVNFGISVADFDIFLHRFPTDNRFRLQFDVNFNIYPADFGYLGNPAVTIHAIHYMTVSSRTKQEIWSVGILRIPSKT